LSGFASWRTSNSSGRPLVSASSTSSGDPVASWSFREKRGEGEGEEDEEELELELEGEGEGDREDDGEAWGMEVVLIIRGEKVDNCGIGPSGIVLENGG